MATQPTIAEAMADFKKKIRITSPPGIAVYPHIIKQDEYQLKENNKNECNTSLRLDPTDPGVAEYVAAIDAYAQEAYAIGKAALEAELAEAKGKKLADLKKQIADLQVHTSYKPDYDDDGEENGLLIFSAKTQVAGVDKKSGATWEREVPVYDSQAQAVKGKARADMKLWGGSTITISTQVVPFCAAGVGKAGISLRLLAVQVHELATGSGSSDSFGFGVSEGGFKADTFDNATAPESASTSSTDDEPEDF